MTPGQKRGFTALASLTLATAALGGTVSAQSPDASMAATSGPDLFGTTYPERVTAGTPGGIVIIGDWQEANQWNPYYQSQVTETDVLSAYSGFLVVQTDDFKYLPDLAESVPTIDNGGVVINADGSATVTWKLREGRTWSDGEPLTCSDWKFTAEWISDPANIAVFQGKVGFLTSAGLKKFAETSKTDPEDINLTIDCPSDTDMVWTFKEPHAGYITLMQWPLPEHYVKNFAIADMVAGSAGYTNAEMVNAPVSGAFKFESVTPAQEVRMARNDLYKGPLTDGPAYLDGVVFKWYANPSAMIAAYAGGEPEYDLGKDLNNSHVAAVQGMDKVVVLDSLTYELLRPNWSPDHCSVLLQPTRNNECPMSDPNVRKALALALDRDAIKARLLPETSLVAYTGVSPQAWFYATPETPPAVDLAGAAAALDTDFPVNPNSGYRFRNTNGVETYFCVNDPAASPHTSADTDTCPEEERAPIRDEGEYDLKIEACTSTSQARQDLLAMVSGMLNQVGVQVTISPVAGADIFNDWTQANDQTPCNLQHGNFDLALHAFSLPLDPSAVYGLYHSSQFPPSGGNAASISDPALDAALTTLKGTVDLNGLLTQMADFQQYYRDNTLEVPVYFRNEVYLQSPKLQNFTGNPTTSGPTWNIADWYWSE